MSEHQTPRVSIGMPVYNAHRFLAETLDSFLAQTYGDFEIIICDNASTDCTPEICDEYVRRDPRIRYFRADKNGGIAWNFNRAVEFARGEYFKWAAHDDLCTPDFLESCVACLDQNPEAAWCQAWTGFIDDSGRRTTGPGGDVFSYLGATSDMHGARPQARGPGRDASQPSARFDAVLLGPGECYDTYGMMRLSLLRRTQLQPPYFGGDKVLITELSLQGRFVEIPGIKFLCRQHTGQSVWTSRRQQELLNSGRDPGRIVIPRRIRCLLGYLGVVMRAELSWRERIACLGSIVRFVIQPRKWRNAVNETIGSIDCEHRLEMAGKVRRSQQEATP